MEGKMKADVLVVDDHCLILEGICAILNTMPDVIVVDAVTSGQQASELIDMRDYDVYILDISMPEVDGFDLIKKIRELNERARIIVYTMHEEIWIVKRLAQSEVNAIVLKSSSSSELIDAVQSVLQGESYTCSRFSFINDRLHRTLADLQFKGVPTKRECDVLHAVAKGLNTRQIAELLKISDNTVETFRKRLILKFEAKNAVDLVVKAISQGFICAE